MFKNLFKSAPKQPEVSVAIASKYPSVVDQIHNEFAIAGETLLNEALEILAGVPESSIEKAERLKKLGFKQVTEIHKAEAVKITKEAADLIKYYQQYYPNNKFITEQQVKTICHKYNLVCGGVDRFRGFVPEVKLKEIEGFKIRKEDDGIIMSNGMCLVGGKIIRSGNYYHVFKTNSDKEFDRYGYAFQSNDGESFYSGDTKNVFGYKNRGDVRCTAEPSLKICAPVKDMDIKGMELKDGYRLEKHIPDPVVLRAVKGGYLILAAWGDEASDELVVNQKMN